MDQIKTAQYHIEQTVARPVTSPEVTRVASDVVREGSNAWWSLQSSPRDMKTGVVKPVNILVVRNKAGATKWYDGTAQATFFTTDENGVLPEASARELSVVQPFDILRTVTAQGDGMLRAAIDGFSIPPRTVTAERDPKDANIFYITMHSPDFNGPKGQAVLDGSKGFLMTKMTVFSAPNVIVNVVKTEVAQVGPERLWFPMSCERVSYDPKQPETVTRRETPQLSNVVLNEKLPPDAFEMSRLNFPDGLKVSIRPSAGEKRLMVWFKGTLLDMDAYMALDPSVRKPL